MRYHAAMKTLHALVRYNAWGNRRVFDVVTALEQPLLTEQARGTIGSIEETLKHLVGVEEVYLLMLQGRDFNSLEPREAYYAHELTWFRVRSAELGSAYEEWVAGINDSSLEWPLNITWIDVPLTANDGLVQMLTHSAHHRAQVFSTLGDRGRTVPDLDYVEMLKEAAG